ncbi:MAG TPA: TIGR00282 family metallophosphoesterase [Chthonomonas sp.]|uniref:TIGR00282 family metallophosphoesterase n=1 Tax=Chthonomonas sp. TaxID=2282153 RepID=UPI002B4ACCAB|nr:TIGR00282 family metallophosphoesterase [Chthonomonas sp.]HLH79662.1 TIGR00282 family metallophosphoesterase [Chthonomonas sp.]
MPHLRLLMIGDVVGRPGRELLLHLLKPLREEFQADFVVANAENAAGGIGITPALATEMLEAGVDVLTLGNHAWGKRDIYPMLDTETRLLRPANYPPLAPGRGWGVYPTKKVPVGILVLQGRTFMEPVDDPFRTADNLLTLLRSQTSIILVDFHAEATSEKQALGWYLDGKVGAVIGTHTHVQTADERILPKGSAYLTDVGMTGPIDSIIGMDCNVVLERFRTLLPVRMEVAEGPAQLSGVLVELDTETGKAHRIHRIQRPEYIHQRGDS